MIHMHGMFLDTGAHIVIIGLKEALEVLSEIRGTGVIDMSTVFESRWGSILVLRSHRAMMIHVLQTYTSSYPVSNRFYLGFLAIFQTLMCQDRASASSLVFLLAALISSTFSCFSAFFRSITSTALFIPSFSNNLLLWQNSYIKKEPKTNEPTAQLQADETVAVTVSLLPA